MVSTALDSARVPSEAVAQARYNDGYAAGRRAAVAWYERALATLEGNLRDQVKRALNAGT